jgi:hypothetical protein
MSNVLRRLFLRQPVHAEERSCGDQVMMSPPAREHGDRRVASTTLEPGPVQAANDSKPAGPANDSMPLEAASDPKPAKPPNDEETVELQIAALLSAWDKTSLCARRAFLTRIDQRMITTHRVRSASANSASEAATG